MRRRATAQHSIHSARPGRRNDARIGSTAAISDATANPKVHSPRIIDLPCHSYIGVAFRCVHSSIGGGGIRCQVSLNLTDLDHTFHESPPFLVRLYFIGLSPCVPWRMRPLFLFEIPTPQRQRQLGCACACFASAVPAHVGSYPSRFWF